MVVALTTNILPTNEATLLTLPAVQAATTNVLPPENYPLYVRSSFVCLFVTSESTHLVLDAIALYLQHG